MHTTIGLFEVHETMKFSMVRYLQTLFEKYDLMHCMIVFVKDESNNMTTMVTTQLSIIDCHPLNLRHFYRSRCLGHNYFAAMSS